MSKKVFVTVGTTQFDYLLLTVTSTDVLDYFNDHGYTQLTLQKGRGDFELETTSYKNLKIECFRYKDTIVDDIQEASLVLSHAGAGSILETLSLRKSLVVVVNEGLMDNHQHELASKMAEEGYLYYCTCSTLFDTLRTKNLTDLKSKPIVDSRVFGDYIDKFVGIA